MCAVTSKCSYLPRPVCDLTNFGMGKLPNDHYFTDDACNLWTDHNIVDGVFTLIRCRLGDLLRLARR